MDDISARRQILTNPDSIHSLHDRSVRIVDSAVNELRVCVIVIEELSSVEPDR